MTDVKKSLLGMTFRLVAALTFVLTAVVVAGCGVRGKPQPPLTPPELGRGQPTFKRATEEFAFPNVPSPEASPDARKTLPAGPAGRDSNED